MTDKFVWYKNGLYILYLNETKDKVVAYDGKNFRSTGRPENEEAIEYMESFIGKNKQYITEMGFEEKE